jgi:hypothetical protein
MPDLVLDYHRLKTPIDHPDLSVTRTKLEYPTENIELGYLVAIGKMKYYFIDGTAHRVGLGTSDSFTDKALDGYTIDNANHDDYQKYSFIGRMSIDPLMNSYLCGIAVAKTTADNGLVKYVKATGTVLATEAVDLAVDTPYAYRLSISGSTIKVFRTDLTTPKFNVTDTSFTSGAYGVKSTSSSYRSNPMHGHIAVKMIAPSSPASSAQTIIETDIDRDENNLYIPKLSKSFAEITSLTGLPDFLYLEAKKYQILKAKGFTDEEMKLIFGYIPQHQVDSDSVTWGAFEFHPDKANTVIITITGDNPYKSGAIGRQKSKAKRVFNVSKDYNKVVSLYSQLKKDYPHWLAGKDNFAYQILGLEELDWLQNVDFYYGELIEHKTHYDQIKRVPDWEIRTRLLELRKKISGMTILTDERDKHLRKIDEIFRIGW